MYVENGWLSLFFILSIIASLAQILGQLLGHGRTRAGFFELPSYQSTMVLLKNRDNHNIWKK